MLDQSNAERTSWRGAGTRPGARGRLRDHERPACAPASKPKRARTTTSPSSNTPRRSAPTPTTTTLGWRSTARSCERRRNTRFAPVRSPPPTATRKRSSSTRLASELNPADATVERGAARNPAEAADEDRGHAERQDRARIADRTRSRICRLRASTCRQTPSCPIRSSSVRPAAATSSARSRNSRG